MRFEHFRGKNRLWYWRLKAENNRTIAVGGEGFHNLGDVISIIETVQRDAPAALVVPAARRPTHEGD